MARRIWTLAAAAAVMNAGLVWGGEVPRPAPPLSVPTPDGQQLSLENLRGKVVLLEFMLTD